MKYWFLIIILTIILAFVFLSGIPADSFLFLHDEFLTLTKEASANNFFTRNPLDLGIGNTTTLIVTFWTRLYYYIIYNILDLSLYTGQKLLYVLKIFLSLALPYIGFKKLTAVYNKSTTGLNTFLISFWYAFNSYTMIYWHGNAFDLTLLLCYGLAPLTLFYFHRAVFEENSIITDKLKFVILLFIMSFGLYLYAVFLFVLFFYTILYGLLARKAKKSVKELVVLGILYLPFFLIHTVIFYDMLLPATASPSNLNGGETYGSLRGGFHYPLLMWFSWGIYTYWEPRNIFTFSDHFKTAFYYVSVFLIYFIIIFGALKKKGTILITVFIAIFLCLLFFVKGNQAPFGEIFEFLVDENPLFRVFRSPDNKFGFGLILVTSALLLITHNIIKKNIFLVLMLFIITVQAYPFFTNVVIKGENSSSSTDRIIKITEPYSEVLSYINSNTSPYGYVMSLPPVEFGHFQIADGDKHLGQDILALQSNLPFLYLSEYTGMSSLTKEKISSYIDMEETSKLTRLPIKYFLVRRDDQFQKIEPALERAVAENNTKVFSNKLFDLYQNNELPPQISGQEVTYRFIDPATYVIAIKNLKSTQDLIFLQSFNPNWELVPLEVGKFSSTSCTDGFSYSAEVTECKPAEDLNKNQLSYLINSRIFKDKHKIFDGYANAWEISADTVKNTFKPEQYSINSDGSINFNLILRFRLQSIFYLCVLVSFSYLIVLLIAVVYFDKKYAKKINT